MDDIDPERLERVARQIAAIKMGLVKDIFGENLPDDLWRQAIADASRRIEASDLCERSRTDGAEEMTDAIESAYEARCAKAEKAIAILHDAVQFYANRNHWTSLPDSSEIENVLIADSFKASKDGWSRAEWALRQTAKI